MRLRPILLKGLKHEPNKSHTWKQDLVDLAVETEDIVVVEEVWSVFRGIKDLGVLKESREVLEKKVLEQRNSQTRR